MAVRRRILRIEEARYATALVVARDNMRRERAFPGSVEVVTEVPARSNGRGIRLAGACVVWARCGCVGRVLGDGLTAASIRAM